jgi:ribose 5-phosphate isomerase B
VVDVGAFSSDSVDYPDVAAAAAQRVVAGQSDRAILICGTGVGMCIAANKMVGVRAATCQDELTAELCRRHNDVNVLCLSADVPGEVVAARVIEVWLAAAFEGGRHARRVEKITQLELHRFSGE